MVCRYAFLFLLIPPDLPQSDKSAIHFVALCCVFNISRLTAFFNAETKSLALFTYCPEFFLQFAYQFLPAGFFLRLCRACMAAGLFPPLLCRFSARKTHLKKKVKKQLTKAFPHDKISKSSGEGRKSEYGRVPEWPMGTDCKSAAFSFGGSNPPAPTKKALAYLVR